jgi:tetratricopeptide (TPR) repeat protein
MGVRHAIEQFRAVLDMEPYFPRAAMVDGAYAKKGMYAEALANLEKWRTIGEESPRYWGMLAYLNGRSGRIVEARRALEKLQQLGQHDQIDPIIFARTYIGMKEKDQALIWLEKAYAEHSISLTAFKVDPIYDPLRGDPRFQALLRRLRLAP